MPYYDFDLILGMRVPEDPSAWLDDLAERLFERFEGDATPAVIGGVARVGCTVEAETLERAIVAMRRALAEMDLVVRRAEIETDTLPAEAA